MFALKDLIEIGSFNYKEPMIPQVGRKDRRYPKITLYANQRLKPFFAYLQQVITTQIELSAKKEHKVTVELVGEGKLSKLKLTIDNKMIVMVPTP